MIRIARAVAAGVLVLCAGGCLAGFSLRTGKPIADNQVGAIAPGTTTKDELFERFGIPAAVVARGEVATIPAPATWAAPYPDLPAYSLSADTFCELFPKAPESDEYSRVYYFRHVVSRRMNYFMILALYQTGGTTSDSLWALVNEKTGVVEDYAFRRSGGITVFGVPRRPGPR